MNDDMEKISLLRCSMIEAMEVRGLVAKTQKDYIRHVKDFAGFFGRSPDAATGEDLRDYVLHMRHAVVRTAAFNNRIASITMI